MKKRAPDLDEELDRLEQRLPGRLVRGMRWLRKPSSRWVRIPAGLVLIPAGFLSFLPILGIWMTPLGLVLIAQDVPPLRSPTARVLAWIDSKLPKQKQEQRSEVKTK